MKIFGYVLMCISGLLMMFLLFRKNENYFNINETFRKHLSLFEESKSHYFTFFILPALFAVGLSLLYQANNEFYTELSVIIGVITSILFAVLSILSGYDFSNVADHAQKGKVTAVVKETINSIIFNAVLCVFLMLYNLAMMVVHSELTCNLIKIVFSCITYYIFAVVILTLLHIVKQMSRIIEFNLEVLKKK